jgi:NADH:ubiquinone oxidoreductase subunit
MNRGAAAAGGGSGLPSEADLVDYWKSVSAQTSKERGECVPPLDYQPMVDPFNNKPPNQFKYIWLMFRGLDETEQVKAPENIRYNSANDEVLGTSCRYFKEYEKITPKPATYNEWLDAFAYTDPITNQPKNPTDLPRDWSYAKSTNPFNKKQTHGGGHSLQKSRFKKRKSRKYKSIKKSKKRSFRTRGRH